MNKLLVAAVSLSTLAMPALAADMPVKTPVYKAPIAPASDWSGFYIGGHAGYMWGRSSVWEDGELLERDAPTNGFVGGALAGVNWQSGAWVLGLEGDTIITQDLLLYEIQGEDQNGRIIGRHRATGVGRPRFWERARYFGLEKELAAALDEAEQA